MTWKRLRCALTKHPWSTIAHVNSGQVSQGPWLIEIPPSMLQVCARCGSARLVSLQALRVVPECKPDLR